MAEEKDKKHMIQYRPVTVGPLQDDGLRVIETGLEPGEWVVVSGLQLVRPRMEVNVETESMPVLPIAQSAAGSSGRSSGRC